MGRASLDHPYGSRFTQLASTEYSVPADGPVRLPLGDPIQRILVLVHIDYQTGLGKTNASSHYAGSNADRRSVYLYTLVNMKPWFDSLK